jgi:hypothetical protein
MSCCTKEEFWAWAGRAKAIAVSRAIEEKILVFMSLPPAVRMDSTDTSSLTQQFHLRFTRSKDLLLCLLWYLWELQEAIAGLRKPVETKEFLSNQGENFSSSSKRKRLQR